MPNSVQTGKGKEPKAEPKEEPRELVLSKAPTVRRIRVGIIGPRSDERWIRWGKRLQRGSEWVRREKTGTKPRIVQPIVAFQTRRRREEQRLLLEACKLQKWAVTRGSRR